MSNVIKNDHFDKKHTLEHTGLERPRKPKNHRSTTIILGDGEEAEHKPVSTEDLFAKPTQNTNLEEALSEEKENAIKVINNKAMAGIPLPGMGTKQVRLRPCKSENSYSSVDQEGGSPGSGVTKRSELLSQVKLKSTTSATTDDVAKTTSPRNSLEKKHNGDNANQCLDETSIGSVMDNIFLRNEWKNRDQKRKSQNWESASKSALPSFERQTSNRDNSKAVQKLKLGSVETQPIPAPKKTSQSKSHGAPNSRESSPSHSTPNVSDSSGSSHLEDKRKREYSRENKTMVTDFSGQSAVSARKSSSENESRENKSKNDGERRIRSDSPTEPNPETSPSSQSSEVSQETDNSNQTSESQKENNESNRKSLTVTRLSTSKHSDESSSSNENTKSLVKKPEANSGNHINKKSEPESSPRKLCSNSSTLEGSLVSDKCKSEANSSNENTSFDKKRVVKRRNAPKPKKDEDEILATENESRNGDETAERTKRNSKFATEGDGKFFNNGQEDCAPLVETPENASHHEYEKSASNGEITKHRTTKKQSLMRRLKNKVARREIHSTDNLKDEEQVNRANVEKPRPVKKPRMKLWKKRVSDVDDMNEETDGDEYPSKQVKAEIEQIVKDQKILDSDESSRKSDSPITNSL